MTTPVKTPWYRRWWAVLLLAGCLLFAGTWGWNLYQKHQGDVALAEQVAYLDKTDPNWRFEDWTVRYPPLPDEQNLTIAVLNLKSVLGPVPAEYDTVFTGTGTSPAIQLNEAQQAMLLKMLQDCKTLPAEMAHLLTLQTAPIPVPNRHGKSFRVFTSLSPNIQPIRAVANLVQYQHELWVQANQPVPAMQAVETILHLGHTLEHDAGLINQLVMIAIQNLAADGTQRLLAMTEPPPVGMEKLQARLLQEAHHSFFRQALAGERAIVDRHLREVEEGRYSPQELSSMFAMPSKTAGSPFSIDQLRTKIREWFSTSSFGYIPLERAQVLRFFRTILERVGLPPAPTAAEMKELVLQSRGENYTLSIFGAGLYKVYEADLKRQTLLKIAAALLASERYRQATGKVPTGWNDIVPAYFPAVPIDPWNNQPMKWKNTATGFILYSVWMDGVDDGGLIRYSDNTTKKDEGLEFFAPAHRRQVPLVVPPAGGLIPGTTPP